MKNSILHELHEKIRVLDTDSNEFIQLQNEMFELSESLIKPKGIKDVR